MKDYTRLNHLIIHNQDLEMICETLEAEQIGELIIALKDFHLFDEDREFPKLMNGFFKKLKRTVVDNENKYEKRAERNRENGKKGGRPKKNDTETTPEATNDENTSSNKATEINSLEDARKYFINKPNHTYQIKEFKFNKQTYEKNNETIISYTVGSGIIEEELYYQGHFLINNKNEYEKFKEWRKNFLKTTKNTDIIYYRGVKFTVDKNELVIVNRLSGEFEKTFEEQKIKVFIDAYFKEKGE